MGTSHYGTEVDIWSVGCILIELLTRKIAFQVDERPNMMKNKKIEPFPSLNLILN